MIVTWNAPRVRQICMPMTFPFGPIILNPGTNEVEPELWAEAEKLALVKADLKSGKLRVELDGDYSAAAPSARLKCIAECLDVDVLTRWRSIEKEPRFVVMIDEQIGLITERTKNAQE